MPIAPSNRSLPYTFRAGLTVDSPKYRARLRGELEQSQRLHGPDESFARLATMLGRDAGRVDNFEIERWPAADGQMLYTCKWQAPDPANTIVYVNGLESHAGWFSDVAGALAQRGVAVYALDRRGSGLNTRAAGTHRDWVSDLRIAVENAKRACPGAKIHLASLCFGAAVSSAFAIRYPTAADSLIYISPGLYVKVHPTAAENLRIGLATLPGLACNVHSPIRADEMFADSGPALWFLWRDKLRTVAPRARDFIQASRLIRYVRRRLRRLDVPAVVFLAGRDRVVDIGASRTAFRKLPRVPRIIEYPDSEHIIFFGRAKDRLIADMVDFLTHAGSNP